MTLQAKYTEEQRAVALAYHAASGSNLTKTAKDCKIPKSTLHRWLGGAGVNDAVFRKRDIKKGVMADECERLAWKLLGGLDDDRKIEEAAVNTLSVAFGTLVDKMRLLRGESTQTVNVNDNRTALLEKWAAFAADCPPEAVP